MSDLIKRDEAIETAVSAAVDWHRYANPYYSLAACIGDAMMKMPSAQKNGEWIECDHEKWIIGVHGLRCSQCGGGYHLSNEMTIYYWNFCPNCGADMRGEEDE